MPDDEATSILAAGRTLIQLAHVVVRLEDIVCSRELDLSYRQIRILKHVSAGVNSAKELGRIFGVSAPAISETLELLVRKGLLRREPNETDRRAVTLVLTDYGIEVNEQAERAERALAEEVLAPLDEAEVSQMLDLAAKLLVPNQERLISHRISGGR